MHTHKHEPHHQHRHEGAVTRLLIALSIILFFAVVEVIGGFLANSLALLSDAGHMTVDGLALALAAFSAWLSNKPAQEQMSYGFGRAEILGALFSNIFLIALIICLAIFAIKRLFIGEEHISGTILTGVAFIGLIANMVAAYILHRGEKTLNTRSALLHVLSDMLGSIGAIIAGLVIILFAWYPIDAVLSLLISVLVFISSFRLLKETLHVLMEGVPRGLRLKEIRKDLKMIEGVESVHDLHVWNLSSNKVMLTAHIKICDPVQWPKQLVEIHRVLKDNFGISHITIQPELAEQCHIPLHHQCE